MFVYSSPQTILPYPTDPFLQTGISNLFRVRGKIIYSYENLIRNLEVGYPGKYSKKGF